MSKYTKLDQVILDVIKEQPQDLSNLGCALVARGEGSYLAWEVARRRLQVLRKAGKVIFYRSTWLLAAQRGE